MKILYVLRYYPTLTETFVYREMTELVSRGHSIMAVAIGSRSDGALADQLPPIEVIRPPSGLSGLLSLPSALWGFLTDPSVRRAYTAMRPHLRWKDALRALWGAKEVQKHEIDQIHVHFGGEAAEWAVGISIASGVAFSVMIHAVDLYKPRAALEQTLSAAEHVMTISEANQKELVSRFGVSASLVRCGVDLANYSVANAASEGPLRIISVGRLVPKKGLDLLVEAVRVIDVPIELRLVTEAPALNLIPQITTGALPPSLIANELANSHIFVLPCRVAPDGDRDGIPVAIMEAMASSLPILTTAVSGIGELVDEEVGWVIAPDNLEELIDALKAAAASPSERARRGANAREQVKARGFTVVAQVDALEAIWGGNP